MSDMQFVVELYETEAGNRPVARFLKEQARRDPRLAAALTAGIDRLQFASNHGRPLTAPLRDGVFELRARGNAQGRILFSFQRDKVILLLAGLVKKTSAVPSSEVDRAVTRKSDWEQRRMPEA